MKYLIKNYHRGLIKYLEERSIRIYEYGHYMLYGKEIRVCIELECEKQDIVALKLSFKDIEIIEMNEIDVYRLR